jgi:hypothetical protein
MAHPPPHSPVRRNTDTGRVAGLIYDAHVVTGPTLLVVNVVGTDARVERYVRPAVPRLQGLALTTHVGCVSVVDQYLQTTLTASHHNHERVLEGTSTGGPPRAILCPSSLAHVTHQHSRSPGSLDDYRMDDSVVRLPGEAAKLADAGSAKKARRGAGQSMAVRPRSPSRPHASVLLCLTQPGPGTQAFQPKVKKGGRAGKKPGRGKPAARRPPKAPSVRS